MFLRGCELPSECILFLQINMCLLKYPHGPYYRPIILAQKTWHFYVFTEPDFYLHVFFFFPRTLQDYQGRLMPNINQKSLRDKLSHKIHYEAQSTRSTLRVFHLYIEYRMCILTNV